MVKGGSKSWHRKVILIFDDRHDRIDSRDSKYAKDDKDDRNDRDDIGNKSIKYYKVKD